MLCACDDTRTRVARRTGDSLPVTSMSVFQIMSAEVTTRPVLVCVGASVSVPPQVCYGQQAACTHTSRTRTRTHTHLG
jgi:hypothetical protein